MCHRLYNVSQRKICSDEKRISEPLVCKQIIVSNWKKCGGQVVVKWVSGTEKGM
jgi:hypothetical protein